MKNKFKLALIFSLLISPTIAHSADSANLFTPEEYADFVFEPKRETMYAVDRASYPERVGLVKTFREVQRERARILKKDFSENQLSITKENMDDLSKVSNFINNSMDSKENEDYSNYIRTDKNLPLSEDLFAPKENVVEEVVEIEEAPKEIIIKESDTIKHIQTRRRFGS